MVITQIWFYGSSKTKWKMTVGATKIQPDGSDKKEVRKRGYHWNIIIVLVKWNEKCKLLLLKWNLMVQTKRNQEKVVVTKICFYDSAKLEQEIKACLTENKGSVAKMSEMKIAEGINILLEHKSIGCLDHFKSCMWTKIYMCTWVHVHIYIYIWTKAYTYCKNMKFSYMYAYGHICYAYVNTCTWAHVYM